MRWDKINRVFLVYPPGNCSLRRLKRLLLVLCLLHPCSRLPSLLPAGVGYMGGSNDQDKKARLGASRAFDYRVLKQTYLRAPGPLDSRPLLMYV
jgi:hypothetical protein